MGMIQYREEKGEKEEKREEREEKEEDEKDAGFSTTTSKCLRWNPEP